MDNRRAFLRKVLSAASAAAIVPREARAQDAPSPAARSIPQTNLPWFKRTTRWMQTNIAELDATRYDIPFWRAHWKRTHTQGIVVNAGGIVAYYPTKVPF